MKNNGNQVYATGKQLDNKSVIFFLHIMNHQFLLFFKCVFLWFMHEVFPNRAIYFPIKWQRGTISDFSQQSYIVPLNLWLSSHFSLSHNSSPLLCCFLRMSPLTWLSSSALTSIFFYLFSFHLNVSVWSSSSILDTSQPGSLPNSHRLKSLTNQSSEALVPLLSSQLTNCSR